MSLRQLESPPHARRLRGNERGASMVEVSLALPIFLLLVFGIIEFSYAFAQNNEIRHLARDAAREASVDPSASPISLVCDNLALIRPGDVIEISVTPNSASAGDSATIEVSAGYSTLTGFFDGAFAGVTLETSHQFYVEQPTTGGSSMWGPPGGCP